MSSFSLSNDAASNGVEEAYASTEDWCSMHILIDQLSAVQKRLGTPLEQPGDFLRVRGLGSHIREKLDDLNPLGRKS